MGLQSDQKMRSSLMPRRLVFSVAVLAVLAVATAASATERQNNSDYRARRMALARSMENGALVLFAPTEAEGPNNLFGFRQEDNF